MSFKVLSKFSKLFVLLIAIYCIVWFVCANLSRALIAQNITECNNSNSLHLVYDSIHISGFPWSIRVKIDKPKLIIYNKFTNYLLLTNSLLCNLDLFAFTFHIIPEDGLLFALQDKQIDQITHEYKITFSNNENSESKAIAKVSYSRKGKIKSLECCTGDYLLFDSQNQLNTINISDLNLLFLNLSPHTHKLLCSFKLRHEIDNKKIDYAQVRSITNFTQQLNCLTAHVEALEVSINENTGLKCSGRINLFESARPDGAFTVFLRNHEKLIDRFVPHNFFLRHGVLKKLILDHAQVQEDGVELKIITDKSGLYIGSSALFGYDN